jgi:hypothetical protein
MGKLKNERMKELKNGWAWGVGEILRDRSKQITGRRAKGSVGNKIFCPCELYDKIYC